VFPVGLAHIAKKPFLAQIYTAGKWNLKDYDMPNSFILVPSFPAFSNVLFYFNLSVSITSWQ